MKRFTIVFLMFGALASADTFYLRNGEAVQGTYLGGTARQIRIDVNGNIQTYDVGQLRSIDFSDPSYQPPPASPASASASAPSYQRDRAGYVAATLCSATDCVRRNHPRGYARDNSDDRGREFADRASGPDVPG